MTSFSKYKIDKLAKDISCFAWKDSELAFQNERTKSRIGGTRKHVPPTPKKTEDESPENHEEGTELTPRQAIGDPSDPDTVMSPANRHPWKGPYGFCQSQPSTWACEEIARIEDLDLAYTTAYGARCMWWTESRQAFQREYWTRRARTPEGDEDEFGRQGRRRLGRRGEYGALDLKQKQETNLCEAMSKRGLGSNILRPKAQPLEKRQEL